MLGRLVHQSEPVAGIDSGPVSPGQVIEAVGVGLVVGSVDGEGISEGWGAQERPTFKG